jgi:hypothetical protein
MTPRVVGRRAEANVHFRLRVSFLIVRRVVAQGQWNRVKTMKFKAVT